MKTSTSRILTTHVGSIPRPESLTALLRFDLYDEYCHDDLARCCALPLDAPESTEGADR